MGAGGGSRLFGRDIECVWERGVRARERERASEGERKEDRGERGVICVQKWRIDREKMLMLFESGLCTGMQGKRVIVCVIGTSWEIKNRCCREQRARYRTMTH